VGLEWFGIDLDAARNSDNQQVISTPNARCNVIVCPTNEELTIVRHTHRLLFLGSQPFARATA
jgi:acetate kinase